MTLLFLSLKYIRDMNNQNIWIYNPKVIQWFLGFIIDINDNITTVYNSELETEYSINIEQYQKYIRQREPNDNDNIDNLINLIHLNEPSILNVLCKKYSNNLIYTFTGSILLAINLFLSGCASTCMEYRSATTAARTEKNLTRAEEWGLKAISSPECDPANDANAP